MTSVIIFKLERDFDKMILCHLSIFLIKQNPTKRSFKLSISTCKLSISPTLLAN
jgi:hypothetical protein